MKKYIDADYLTEGRVSNDPVVIAVKCAPAADVEEVVRCKDCWAYETAEYDDGYKKRVCRLFKRQMQENDFCSYGEPPDSFEKHSIAKMDGKENENV